VIPERHALREVFSAKFATATVPELAARVVEVGHKVFRSW